MSLYQIDKQTPVSLPQICAPRAELMQTLETAAQNQYIYIHAPAGYGKTISTLLWLKKSGSRAIWMSLDVYDNTPVLFYRLLCMSILSVLPHDAEILQAVKSASFSADPVESTIELITRLTFEDARYTLVFDDFHLITNEEIVKSLPFVLKRLPFCVTVFLLSRNKLPESFAVLRDQQKLICIDSAALALNRDEIKKHFAGYGRFITTSEAEKIHSYTEGWIIALNAIAVSGNITVSENSQALSFYAYIDTNIWNKTDHALQDFLMKSAVADKFSLELCQSLTEDSRCGIILDSLLGSSINISLMGAEYRYHNLFLEFLRVKLDQSSLDKAALNKRAAEYYLQKGDFLTAKNYAMKSRDPAVIAQAVRSFYSLKTFSLDEYIEFHQLYGIHAIPEAICERSPILYVPRIFFSYAIGDFTSVCHYFDKLYPLIPRIAESQPEVLEHVNSMIMLDCRIRLSSLHDRAETLPAITKASENLQSPTFTLQLPFPHRCVRDFYELTNPKLRKSISAFSANIIKKNVDIMFMGAEAGLLMEQNKLHDAYDIAVSLKSTLNDEMSPEFVYALYILTAELSLLLRRKDHYEAAIKEVKDYITANACQYLLKNVSAYEARIRIQNGDKTAAEKWLQNYYIDDASFGQLYKIYRNFTTVRAYILLGQTDKAVDALYKLKELAESFDRPLDTAEADVLLAVAEWSSGKKKEAQVRLLHALPPLFQYGFTRVVAGEGKAVLPIISAVIRQLDKSSERSEGLTKFAKEIYLLAYDQGKHFKGILYNSDTNSIQLSAQQTRVLELLARGYTNAEIVRETGLSLNTIRTHTKLAYQKLKVNNSKDAIVSARQLGLIQ